jgi:hypothetical protein
VWEAIRRGDVAGLARAGAIIIGLLVTASGFLSGKVRQWLPSSRSEEVHDQAAPGAIQ